MNYMINKLSIAGTLVFFAADKGGGSGGAATDTPETPETPEPPSVPKFEVKETGSFELRHIKTDAGTQPRVSLDQDVIDNYAEVIARAKAEGEGIPFPSVTLFRTPEGKLILAEGFHRFFAHKQAKQKEIEADIIEGTVRDAIVFSCGANATHGLPRSRKDKQRAVKTLLTDEEWSLWSNVQIAKLADVSEAMVRDLRPVSKSQGPRKVVRGGKVTTMKTGRIGKKGGKAPKVSKKKGAAAASTGASTQKKSADDSLDRAIRKLVNVIGDNGANPEGKKLEKALADGSLALTPRDVKEWAESSESRIKKIHPLVVDHRMSPKRAYALIDDEVTGKTKVEELILMAVAGGGEYSIKVEGFTVSIKK